MKRLTYLRLVNVLLALFLINQVVTALIHGSMTMETYERIHGLGGFALFILGVLHVILNWNWIRSQYFRKSAKSGSE